MELSIGVCLHSIQFVDCLACLEVAKESIKFVAKERLDKSREQTPIRLEIYPENIPIIYPKYNPHITLLLLLL